jgi:DNA-binding MarR family transcriptional regulator
MSSTTISTPLDDRELQAWRGLLRTHAALTKSLDARLEAAHSLSLSTYEVLASLLDADGHRMRMCELANTALLSRSGLSRLADRLERDGLIARASCHDDARGAYAVLTPAGAAKLREARATHLAAVRETFLGRLNADELDALGAAWGRLSGAADTPPV